MTTEEARSLWLFDDFVNFSPPFNILSRRLKAVLTLCYYQQQRVTYCNGSLQSREDVFEFIIAAESASNLQCALTRTNGAEKPLTAALHRVRACVRVYVCVRPKREV